VKALGWLARAALAVAVGVGVFTLPQGGASAQDRPPLQDDEPPPPDQPPPPDEPPPGTPPPAGGAPAAPAARELDTTSPEALALTELLHVPHNYGKDGNVELLYNFSEEAQLLDWANQGFDRSDIYQGTFTLGVGSQGQALIQHCLEMTGKYEVSFKVRLEWVSTRSDLVFLVGKGGGRFGNQFVEKQSRGFRPLGRNEPARDRFGGGRDVTVKYAIDGDDITVWLNGAQMGTTDKLRRKLDGKVGMWMTDMRMVVQQVELKGRPDTSKL
jgi:hypothetical protein